MATYKSTHKGSQIDTAVSATLWNKGKGNSTTPIYYDEYTRAQEANVDTDPSVGSQNLVRSGGIYTGLDAVVANSDIQTSTSLGTSGMPPSQNAVKQYVDNSLPAKQDNLYGGYGIDVNGVIVSISDDVFREDEEASLHADLKVDHFGDMSVGNDSDVLELMDEARHSSFDRSKFTVVGSPIVTSDGIASGFSTSNYLAIDTSSLVSVTEFTEEFEFTTSSDITTRQEIYGGSDYNSTVAFLLRIWTDGKFYIDVRYLDNSSFIYWSYTAAANTTYKMKFKVKNGVFYWYVNGEEVNHKTVDNPCQLFGATSYLGRSSNNLYPFLGSIDLKQFSITVAGVPYFSGNKTGIDTIKPDDYTVIGTPTISADGVVSGFGSSDYIQVSQSLFDYTILSTANTWKIQGRYLYTGVATSIWGACFGYNNSSMKVYLRNDTGAAYAMLSFDGSSQDNPKCTIEGLVINTYYIIELEFTGTQYILSVYNIDGSLFGRSTYNSTSKIYTMSAFQICAGAASSTTQTDLNSFKIYVNGNLVYQPCLKIPYTQTKDGKKIVDSQYRSRVEDEYTQVGFTPYYTLSGTDYTMATVEGDDIVSSLDGATNYTQRADLSIEQQGTTTSGTTVTFPKAFTDTNYALSIPYSAKTKTGFTAAADGDYIAEGNVSI